MANPLRFLMNVPLRTACPRLGTAQPRLGTSDLNDDRTLQKLANVCMCLFITNLHDDFFGRFQP